MEVSQKWKFHKNKTKLKMYKNWQDNMCLSKEERVVCVCVSSVARELHNSESLVTSRAPQASVHARSMNQTGI